MSPIRQVEIVRGRNNVFEVWPVGGKCFLWKGTDTKAMRIYIAMGGYTVLRDDSLDHEIELASNQGGA